MDRDNRWERIELAHKAMTEAVGRPAPTAGEAIASAHAIGETDEFIAPTVIGDYAGMQGGDGIMMVNFRSDRVREILDALGGPGFDGFARRRPDFAVCTGMVSYSERHNVWMDTIMPPLTIPDTLGETGRGCGPDSISPLPRRKSIRMSRFSSMAARRIRLRVKRGTWSPVRRSEPTISSRRCRRGKSRILFLRQFRSGGARSDRDQLRKSRHGRPYWRSRRCNRSRRNGRWMPR